MISVRGLTGGYGQTEVIRDIDLDIEPGTLVAILGANGAGKSTLIRGVIGALPSQVEATTIHGERPRRLTPQRCLQDGIAHVPEGRGIFGQLTVYENLRLGSGRDGSAFKGNVETVHEIFPVLSDRREQRAGTLSGGEQQMLAIGRGLMSAPRYLLVDEPSLGLAPLLVKQTFEFLRSLCETRNLGVLLAEQNHLTVKYADRVVLIDQGVVTRSVDPRTLSKDDLRDLYLGTDPADAP